MNYELEWMKKEKRLFTGTENCRKLWNSLRKKKQPEWNFRPHRMRFYWFQCFNNLHLYGSTPRMISYPIT